MKKKISLLETSAVAPEKKGNRWLVVVATPGEGSSGFYSEEVLRRDAHKIVPAGGQSFINHDNSRNPKDLIGVFPEGSFWDEERSAVLAELETFTHWTEFVDEVGPHCGMSLYAVGERDEDGNITEILEDRLNGCDLVARPGLVGSGLVEKIYETAVRQSQKDPSVTVAEELGNEDNVEKVEAKLAELTAIVASLVADKETAQAAEAQVEADTALATARVESFAAAVEAVDKAELFESQRKSILEQAKEGADVTALIEEAKQVRKEALESVQTLEEGHGRVYSGTTDVTFSGFGV